MQELDFIFRKSKAACFLFGLPFVFTLLCGFVYSQNTLKAIPTVFYDQDQSSASRSLLMAFADSERFEIVGVVDTEEAMEKYLQNEQALVAIGVPADFAANIKKGLGTEVLLSVNAENLMYPNSAINFAREILTTYNIGLGKKLVEAIGQVPNQAIYTVQPIATRMRILYNPTDSYSPFMLPGLATNGLQIGIILAICLAIVREYKQQILWQKYSTLCIVAGKLAAYWVCAVFAAVLACGMYIYFYAVPFHGEWGSLLLIYGAFTFAVTSLGLLFSAAATSEIIPFHPIEFLYFMPAFLYSGYSWPHIAKNSFTYLYSYILPMNYAVDTIRDLLLIGYSADLWQNVVILGTGGVSVFIATVGVCRYRVAKMNAANAMEAKG